MKLPTADLFKNTDIFPMDKDIHPLQELRETREKDIKIAEPDVGSFMIQKFSENGMKNIFGKVKDE